MPTSNTAYPRLLELSREISALESVAKLLSWDQQTYMPQGGFETRAEQRGVLARLLHERLTCPEMGNLLEQLNSARLMELGDDAAANVRELRRIYDRETRVPPSLVKELEQTSSLSFQAWLEAKEKNAYSVFSPWLEKLVGLTKERVAAIGYVEEPYDALLEDYEPGLTLRTFQAFVAPVREQLGRLVGRIVTSPRKPDSRLVRSPLDAATVQALGREIALELGFDLKTGRIDASAHPFCSGQSMQDVRLTTYFNPENPLDSLFAVIHEAGHGMYHQGLPAEHRGTPLGKANSLAVHESQARWWENFVARSRPFWERYFPRLQSLFPQAYGAARLDDFYWSINCVTPSPVRVEADEVTYNLHVLLRVEMEWELFRGSLSARDVPEAWDAKMEAYLGIRPQTLVEGALQDVHWARGMFGYFATYLLGNILAAQWHAQLVKDIPDFGRLVLKGEFQPLLRWMRAHVHRHGSRYQPAELVRRATGSEPDPSVLITYLAGKYSALYQL